MTLRAIPPERTETGEKWRDCCLCGAKSKQIEIDFDSGSVEPTVGETLTGADSTETATVVSVQRLAGTYAGGDVVGTVVVSSPSGDFDAEEDVNGSTGGNNMFTTIATQFERYYGRLWPESQMAFREGKWYCSDHYLWRFVHRDIDEVRIDIDEEDRGTRWNPDQ